MLFKKMNDDEINNMGGFILLPPGIYDFKILDAIEEISQSGNPMFKLKMLVWNHRVKTTIQDRITYTEKAPWIVGNFCKAIGQSDKLKEGSLSPRDVINRSGQCEIENTKQEGTDKVWNKVKRFIGDKNEIDHLAKVKSELPPLPKVSFDEEIPF